MTISQTRTFRSHGFFGLLFLLLAAPLLAQIHSAAPTSQTHAASSESAQPSLRFDVASIRRHESSGDEPSNRQILPGGRFIATATTVRTLIRIAFGTEDNLMSSTPGWTDTETFDITATTANHVEVTTPQQFQQVILTLLEDRFGFKFHREPKEAAIYWLEVDKLGKLGPALKPSAPDSQPNMSTTSNGSRAAMKATKTSMADVAGALRRQAGRPVEDHTNLKGDFDLQIEWSPQENADSAYPSLFTVVKEQLGLKLQPAKGTIETLVVDRISQPSDN